MINFKVYSIYENRRNSTISIIILNTRLSKVPAKINHETIHIKQQQNCLCFIFLLGKIRIIYIGYVTRGSRKYKK
jgi:hypothetical protein